MRRGNQGGKLLSRAFACLMSVVLASGAMVPGALTAYAQENSLGIAGVSLEPAVDVSGNETLHGQSAEGPATSIVIAGTTVIGSNADIFGDGTASFDASTGTLTLNDFATTGNDPGNFTLVVREGDLTLELHGNNTFAAGTNAHGVWVWHDLTITGDGNLAATGGKVSTDSAEGICVDGAFTIADSYTGTVVATGGNGQKSAEGVFCAGGLNIHGGTLIATGGYSQISCGVEVTRLAEDGYGLTVAGGTLIAQGGNGSGSSYGIWGYDGSKCRFEGGVSVIRSGLMGGSLNYSSSYLEAFHQTTPEIDASSVKVAEKVGVVSGSWQKTTGNADSNDTGIVIVPNGYVAIDNFASLPSTLTGDVYHVSTTGSNFGADSTKEEGSLDLDGHQAVFVNLFESNGVAEDIQAGAVFNASTSYSLSGYGELVSVGGVASGSKSASRGLYASCPLAVDGPKVTCVGSAAYTSEGCKVDGPATIASGNLVGVGGTAYGKYSTVTHSSGVEAAVSANGDATVLGAGGLAFNLSGNTNVFDASLGLSGNATANGNAHVMGVGGFCVSVFFNTYSKGISGLATATGGVVAGVGGYATKYSTGCDSGMVSHSGAKVVALGGVVLEGAGNASYGSMAAPVESLNGEQLVAGRTMPYACADSDKDKPFYACSANDKANAYSDFYGTQGKTAVNHETTQETISTFKRVEINKTEPAPITVERPAGANFTYDGTYHTGVAQGGGYTLTGTSTAVDANDYTVTANLKGGYVWDDGTYTPKLIAWSISPAPITSVSVENQTYTGSALRPTPVVKAGGITVPASGYSVVSYSDNTGVGVATVQVVGKGNFTGNKSGTFAIGKASIAGAAVRLSSDAFVYNGGKQAPAVASVTLNGKPLTPADFDVVYSNANSQNAGGYSVTVSGKGNYAGSASASYSIAKASVAVKAKKGTVTVSLKKVKKKAQSISNITVAAGQGKATYKNVSKKKAAKKFKVNSKGKLTVPKGTKKGAYAVKIKVTTKGGANYNKGSKTVSFKVKVK